MKALVAISAVLALAGCPKKNGGTTTTGDGDGSGTGDVGRPNKEAWVSFGTESLGGPDADPPRTKIWLAVTDETGSAKSYPIEEVPASCSVQAGGEMGALGTLRCWYAGGGADFVVVARSGEFIILRRWTDEADEEPADFQELSRVTIPAGARVEFQP